MSKLGFHIKASMMLLLMLSLVTSSVPINGQTVYIPDFVDSQEVILDGMGNDLYFRTSPAENILTNSQLEVEEGSFNLFARSQTGLSHQGGVAKGGVFTNLFGNTVYQARNNTADDLQVRYRTSFYDLLNTSSVPVDDADENNLNVFIKDDESYYFTFEVAVAQMLMFVFLFSQGDNGFFDLNLQIVDSEGNVFTTSRWDPTNVKVYIPMFAKADSYIARIYSNNHNGLLQDFYIMDNLEAMPVTDGYSEEGFTGHNSRFNLFEVNSVTPSVMTIGATTRNSPFLGTINLRAFSETTNPFGSVLNNDIRMIKKLDQAFVTAVATSVDDTDPYTRKIKQEFNLPEGFDVDYSFFINRAQLNPLPIGENIMIPSGDIHDTKGHYLYNLPGDTIVGYNTSTFSLATFTPLDGSPAFSLSSSNNDVLNDFSDDLFVVPAGDYIVDLNGDVLHFFSEFPANTFTRGSTQMLNLVLYQPQFFMVPVDGYNFVDSFNITTPDQLNRSASFYLTYYDGTGNYLGDTDFTLDHVEGNGTLVSSNNQTLEQLSGINGWAPTESYYFGIVQYENTLYNSTDINPKGVIPLSGDDMDYVATLDIDLIDAIFTELTNDADLDIFVADLEDGYQKDLNETKSDIFFYFNFNPEMYKAYRIVIDLTNFTLTDVFFYQSYGMRLDLSPLGGFEDDASYSASMATANYTKQTIELEFLAMNSLTHGLHLDINMGSAFGNGTLNISIEMKDIFEFAALPITPFVFPVHEAFEPEPTVGSQITVGIVIIAMLAIPVLFLIRKK